MPQFSDKSEPRRLGYLAKWFEYLLVMDNAELRAEVEKALCVIEHHWDNYGYLGDEWMEAWKELKVSRFSKEVALTQWRRERKPPRRRSKSV